MSSYKTLMANLPIQNFISEFRVDIESTKIVPALAAGFSSGVSLLVAQIAFGSFIFSGELAHYSSLGIGLVLFGNFAAASSSPSPVAIAEPLLDFPPHW